MSPQGTFQNIRNAENGAADLMRGLASTAAEVISLPEVTRYGGLGLAAVDARLVALRSLRVLEAVLDCEARDLVSALRADGATWQAIGDAVMTTRSAAQQKYGA